MNDREMLEVVHDALHVLWPPLVAEYLKSTEEVRSLSQRVKATAHLLHSYGYEIPKVDGVEIPRWLLP